MRSSVVICNVTASIEKAGINILVWKIDAIENDGVYRRADGKEIPGSWLLSPKWDVEKSVAGEVACWCSCEEKDLNSAIGMLKEKLEDAAIARFKKAEGLLLSAGFEVKAKYKKRTNSDNVVITETYYGQTKEAKN